MLGMVVNASGNVEYIFTETPEPDMLPPPPEPSLTERLTAIEQEAAQIRAELQNMNEQE